MYGWDTEMTKHDTDIWCEVIVKVEETEEEEDTAETKIEETLEVKLLLHNFLYHEEGWKLHPVEEE